MRTEARTRGIRIATLYPRSGVWAVLPLVLFAASNGFGVKDKKPSAEFDAPPSRVFDAVYRYAQHHGMIKWTDEKRFSLSGSMSIPGGGWDWRKDFDCTISVEATDGGKKSVVNVVGTYPAKQQSLVGAFKEGPATKVLKGIRDEFDKLPPASAKADVQPSDASVPYNP